ncbi:MAG: hypothetical protein FJ303_07130 [Planctomycetes bacterium]|nr:hypothetical protein [Planctomycetota bacterium]
MESKTLLRAFAMLVAMVLLFTGVGRGQEAGKPGAAVIGTPVFLPPPLAAAQEKEPKKDEKQAIRAIAGHRPLHDHASYLGLPTSKQIHYDRVVDRQFVVPRPGLAILEAPATGFTIPLNLPQRQDVFQTYFPENADLLLNVTANTRVDAVYTSKDANVDAFSPYRIPVKTDPAFGTTGRTKLNFGNPGNTDVIMSLIGNSDLSAGKGLVDVQVGEKVNGQQALRVRHLYGQLTGYVYAGQTDSAFSDPDAVPNTIDLAGPNGRVNMQHAVLGVFVPLLDGGDWHVFGLIGAEQAETSLTLNDKFTNARRMPDFTTKL